MKNKELNNKQKEELMTWFEKDKKWARVINGAKRWIKQGGTPKNDKQEKDFNKTVDTLLEVIEPMEVIKKKILDKARYWKSWQGGGYITLKQIKEHAIWNEDGMKACADWVIDSHRNYLVEAGYGDTSRGTIEDHFLSTIVANIIYPLKQEADDCGKFAGVEFYQRIADYELAQIDF